MTRQLLFLMNAEQAEAFAQLVEAANAGDGGAACRLGDMYREGTGGMRYSPKQAYRWYAKSALTGDANGQNNLGACYEHGIGCAQSYRSAVKWYRLAAAQQCGTAAMNLGYTYLRGHGVPLDKAEALRLFRLAVEQGEDRAEREVERLERDRTPRAAAPTCRSASPGDTPGALPVSSHSASCLVTVPGDASSTRVQQAVHRDGHSAQLDSAARTAPTAGLPRSFQPPDAAQGQRCDGLQGQLRHSPTGPNEPGDVLPDAVRDGAVDKPKVRVIKGIEFVDETESGKHFGIVGGAPPPRPLPGDSPADSHD